jgi:hypothetical protein
MESINDLAKKLAENIFSSQPKHSAEEIQNAAARAGSSAQAYASEASAKLESAVESALDSAKPVASQALALLAGAAFSLHGLLKDKADSLAQADSGAKRSAQKPKPDQEPPAGPAPH